MSERQDLEGCHPSPLTGASVRNGRERLEREQLQRLEITSLVEAASWFCWSWSPCR